MSLPVVARRGRITTTPAVRPGSAPARMTAQKASDVETRIAGLFESISFRKGAFKLIIRQVKLSEFNQEQIIFRIRLRLKRVRFPKFSVSGSARLGFALALPDRDTVCVSGITLTDLNLRRVPNWLDSGWLKKRLNGIIPSERCFDF